jgi:hypothetical protein
MEVVDDLAHTLEGEIIRIESENSSPIHVVWGKLALGLERITIVGTDVGPHGLEGNSSLGVTLNYAGDIDIV